MPRKVTKEWNTYEKVKSGEVCSILTAKELGIYDEHYVVQDEYNDIKTYAKYVSGDAARTKQLCNQNITGDSSHTTCEVEYGMGYMRKPGTTDTCVPIECPTLFTKGENGRCEKPTMPLIINSSSKCDEKSFDWYTIKNYHLGNKYQFHNNKCQAPCPLDYVPNYGKDPVDEQKISNKAVDDLGKCVPKRIYMSGKYAMDQDFCPSAWIKRMNASPSTIEKEIKAGLPEYVSANVQNTKIGAQIRDYVKSTADTVAKECNTLLENITEGSAAQKFACKGLQTNDRLKDVYKICQTVEADADGLKKRWKTEMKETDKRADDKLNVMRQACNVLFCETNSDTAKLLGRPSICFAKVPRINPSETESVDDGSAFQKGDVDETVQSKVMNVPGPAMVGAFLKTMYSITRRLVTLMMAIILIMLLIYVLIYFGLAILERMGVTSVKDKMEEGIKLAKDASKAVRT